MAQPQRRLPDNAPGDFYVDDTCIDCETCRYLAPATFAGSGQHAYVHAQPGAGPDRHRALMALVACPTASIGTVSHADARAAAASFPAPVAGEPGLYYCGYASPDSYGASSWLIVREGGNVLVDSPRAARPLLEGIRALGGARWLFLTHRDDVADHAVLRRELGCERVLHADDVAAGTREVERRLTGRDPTALAGGLLAIPCPGHTPGSMALLHRGVLFTGDHLWGTEEVPPRLHASRGVCWWSWPEQLASLERLLGHDFHLVLPGHGQPYRAASAEAMRAELRALLQRLRRRSG